MSKRSHGAVDVDGAVVDGAGDVERREDMYRALPLETSENGSAL